MPTASRFGPNSKIISISPANVTPALSISAVASYTDPTVTYTVNSNRPFTSIYYDLQGAQSTFFDGAINGNISFDGNGNLVITRNAISYDSFSTRINVLRNNVTPGSLALSNNVNVSPTVNITGISASNLGVLSFSATSNRNNAVINYRLFGANNSDFTDNTANGNITSTGVGAIQLEKTLANHNNVSFVWALRSNANATSNIATSTTFTSNALASNVQLVYFNNDNRLDHRITTNRKNANLYYNFSGLSNSAFSDNIASATVTTGSIGNVIISKSLANANLSFGNTVVPITSFIPAWPTQPSNAEISAELSNNFIGVYGNVFRQTGSYTLQLSSNASGTTFFVGNTSAVGFREVVSRTASRRYNFLANAAPFTTQNGWPGALISGNGLIIFMPGDTSSPANTFIINYNPVSNTFVQSDIVALASGPFNNNGCLSPHNGNIYIYSDFRTPQAHEFLEYNPVNNARRRFFIGNTAAGGGTATATAVDFAVHNPYNNVIFFGCGQGTGLRSVVLNVSANTVANTSVVSNKSSFDPFRSKEFISGVGHPDGNIYLMPYASNNIIRFNHTANSTTRFTFPLMANFTGVRTSGITSTVLGADRRIYGMGDTGVIIAYNPYSNTCVQLTANISVGYSPGCLGPDGNVYFGPYNGSKQFLWVDTNPSSPSYNTVFTGNFGFANLQDVSGLVASNTTIYGIPSGNSTSNTYITAVTVSGNANVNAFYGTFLNKV